MRHLSRRVRLTLVAGALGAVAFAVPATAAHASVKTSQPAAATPSQLISVCLTVTQINFKECVAV